MRAVFLCNERRYAALEGHLDAPMPEAWLEEFTTEKVIVHVPVVGTFTMDGFMAVFDARGGVARRRRFLLQSVWEDNDTAYYVEEGHPCAPDLLDVRTRRARFRIPEDGGAEAELDYTE